MISDEVVTNNIHDIPAPAPTSIGDVSLFPRRASEGRKKNIYPHVIENGKDFIGFVADFSSYPFDEDISRYTTRVFVSNRSIQDLGVDRNFIQPYLEGIIPLSGCRVDSLDDCAIIYLGKNTPGRTPSSEIIGTEIAKARTIFESPNTMSYQSLPDEYSIRILTEADRQNPDIQRQYADLYRAFRYSSENVSEMLLNTHNVLVALFDEGSIVSTGMIEHASLNLARNGQPVVFNIGEITEGFTREGLNGKIYRGKGLYTHVATELMRNEARNGTHLIYSESNADISIPQPLPPVLISAKKQGRESTLSACEKYGFAPGILRRHVNIINDSNDARPESIQNDLLVTYLARERLLQLYGR